MIRKFLAIKTWVKNKHLALKIIISAEFKWACKHLIKTHKIYLLDGPIDVKYFIESARKGRLLAVKYIFSNLEKYGNEELIFAHGFRIFDTVAGIGNLDVLKFLYSISGPDVVFSKKFLAFENALMHKRLDVLQFLYSVAIETGNSNAIFPTADFYAFIRAVEKKHKDVVKYTYAIIEKIGKKAELLNCLSNNTLEILNKLLI